MRGGTFAAGPASPGELKVAIRKGFSDGHSAFELEVEFFPPAAGITILFGASGAGKTTLLNCVAGLQTPDEGRIASGPTVVFDSAFGIDVPPNRRASRLSAAISGPVSAHDGPAECPAVRLGRSAER